MIDDELHAFRDYAAAPSPDARARAHAAVARGMREHRTWRPRRRVMVLALAAAAVACLVVALQPSGPAGTGDRGGGPGLGGLGPTGLEPADAATVRRRVVAALDAADGILHERSEDVWVPSGDVLRIEAWHDLRERSAFRSRETHRAGDGRASGRTIDSGMVPRPNGEILQRTLVDGRCTEMVIPAARAEGDRATSPVDELRRDIRRGRLTIVGERREGDRTVLHVRSVRSDPDHPGIVDRSEVWLDAATYLPIRSLAVHGDPDAGAGAPDEIQRLRSEFDVMPRPADPARLLLPPHDGPCERKRIPTP